MIQMTRREAPGEGRQFRKKGSARANGTMTIGLSMFPEKGLHRPNFASEPRGSDEWAE
jgi:hypothetical protein